MLKTWSEVRTFFNELIAQRGEWAGAPLPISGLKLQLEPRYPYQDLNGFAFDDDEDTKPDTSFAAEDLLKELDPTGTITALAKKLTSDYINKSKEVNSWFSRRTNEIITIFRGPDGRTFFTRDRVDYTERFRFIINTGIASHAWNLDAEIKALERLKQLIDHNAFATYMLTGTFAESSKRSKVIYMFRRCRPTLACRETAIGTKILAALCLHPIGYYGESYAGCLVPTDDVMAHLLLMRGDEHKFWAKANHHPLWAAQAGV